MKTTDTNNLPPPTPTKFPVPLDEFLRLAAGGKYKADRLGKYRAFLRWQVPIQKAATRSLEEHIPETEAVRDRPPATINEIADIIERRKRDGISEENYPAFFETFTRWLDRESADTSHRQHSNAARARWSQDRRHKVHAKKLEETLLT